MLDRYFRAEPDVGTLQLLGLDVSREYSPSSEGILDRERERYGKNGDTVEDIFEISNVLDNPDRGRDE